MQVLIGQFSRHLGGRLAWFGHMGVRRPRCKHKPRTVFGKIALGPAPLQGDRRMFFYKPHWPSPFSMSLAGG
jgi:hypothetical protein